MKDDSIKNDNFIIENNKITVKSLYTKGGVYLCSLNISSSFGYSDYYEQYPTGCLVYLKEPNGKSQRVLFYNNKGTLIMDLNNTTSRGNIIFDDTQIYVDDAGIYAIKYLKNKKVNSEFFSYDNNVAYDNIENKNNILV